MVVMDALNKKEELIYSILFTDRNTFDIRIGEFCEPGDRGRFREEVRTAIKKGGVKINEDRIIHGDDGMVWKIIIRK